MKLNIKIKLKDGAIAPEYKTDGAAGMDLHAFEDGNVPAFGRTLVSTGLFLEIPNGYEGQVRPRSGIALKHGVGVLNSPGTIDSDYRGEVKVILFNTTETPFSFKKGDRVAQIIFAPVISIIVEKVESLEFSDRGDNGFGSTNI